MRALGDLRRKPPIEAPKAPAAAEQPVQEPVQQTQEDSSFDESVVIE